MRANLLLLLAGSCSSTLSPFIQSVHRTTSGLPVSDRLTTSTSPAELGKPLELECIADSKVGACEWRIDGDVVEGHSKTIQANSCHLKVELLAPEHLAAWSCRIELEGRSQFQEAFIHLETSAVESVRLPTHIHPTKYDISALPYIIADNWTIAGLVVIEAGYVREDTNTLNITLHLNDIVVHEEEVTVTSGEGSNIPITGHGYDAQRQFYIIYLDDNHPSMNFTLSIPYTGNLNGDLVGFYRSSYTDSGEQRWMATTQFETTEARRAFPCFDEPIMKANFQVNLGRLPSMSSISNMPIVDEGIPLEGLEPYVMDVFGESLKMSTYLVAFVISEFVYRESEPLENGVKFRIWSRPEAYSQTEYAANIGPRILQFYEAYFNVSFPLPKQDMIAIPGKK